MQRFRSLLPNRTTTISEPDENKHKEIFSRKNRTAEDFIFFNDLLDRLDASIQNDSKIEVITKVFKLKNSKH